METQVTKENMTIYYNNELQRQYIDIKKGKLTIRVPNGFSLEPESSVWIDLNVETNIDEEVHEENLDWIQVGVYIRLSIAQRIQLIFINYGHMEVKFGYKSKLYEAAVGKEAQMKRSSKVDIYSNVVIQQRLEWKMLDLAVKVFTHLYGDYFKPEASATLGEGQVQRTIPMLNEVTKYLNEQWLAIEEDLKKNLETENSELDRTVELQQPTRQEGGRYYTLDPEKVKEFYPSSLVRNDTRFSEIIYNQKDKKYFVRNITRPILVPDVVMEKHKQEVENYGSQPPEDDLYWKIPSNIKHPDREISPQDKINNEYFDEMNELLLEYEKFNREKEKKSNLQKVTFDIKDQFENMTINVGNTVSPIRIKKEKRSNSSSSETEEDDVNTNKLNLGPFIRKEDSYSDED